MKVCRWKPSAKGVIDHRYAQHGLPPQSRELGRVPRNSDRSDQGRFDVPSAPGSGTESGYRGRSEFCQKKNSEKKRKDR